MDGTKGKSFTVPATVYFTEAGILSVNISIKGSGDSQLRKMLEGKQIDENKSAIGVFAKETIDSHFLPRSQVMLSGMFTFTETPQQSKEEIIAAALELAVLRLLDKDNDLCAVCAMHENCTQESNEQGEAFQQPGCNVCAQHVIRYFYERAKK